MRKAFFCKPQLTHGRLPPSPAHSPGLQGWQSGFHNRGRPGPPSQEPQVVPCPSPPAESHPGEAPSAHGCRRGKRSGSSVSFSLACLPQSCSFLWWYRWRKARGSATSGVRRRYNDVETHPFTWAGNCCLLWTHHNTLGSKRRWLKHAQARSLTLTQEAQTLLPNEGLEAEARACLAILSG